MMMINGRRVGRVWNYPFIHAQWKCFFTKANTYMISLSSASRQSECQSKIIYNIKKKILDMTPQWRGTCGIVFPVLWNMRRDHLLTNELSSVTSWTGSVKGFGSRFNGSFILHAHAPIALSGEMNKLFIWSSSQHHLILELSSCATPTRCRSGLHLWPENCRLISRLLTYFGTKTASW